MLALIFVSAAGGGLTAHLLSSERITTGGVTVFSGLMGAMGVDALVNQNHVIFGSASIMVCAVSLPPGRSSRRSAPGNRTARRHLFSQREAHEELQRHVDSHVTDG